MRYPYPLLRIWLKRILNPTITASNTNVSLTNALSVDKMREIEGGYVKPNTEKRQVK